MSISVTCPSCRETFRIKEKYAGQQGACPACREPLVVPADASHAIMPPASGAAQPAPSHSATAQPATNRQWEASNQLDRYRWFCETRCEDPQQLAARIDQALADRRFRPRVAMRYRLQSALLTGCALAMPIIYLFLLLAVAGCCVGCVYLLASIDHAGPDRPNGRGILFLIVLTLGGALTLVLMIRPLFTRIPAEKLEPGLEREDAPLLFLLVDRLCKSLGAVPPKAVYLTIDPGAAAGVGSSWRSIWRSEYTLSLGLPLIAGLTIQELAGVIAHELGHFNQSLACRLTFVVHRIQLWFMEVVFRPHRIDDWLARHTDGDIVGPTLFFMRGPTYTIRKTLKLLMRGAHLAECGLRRQQEFDADQSMSWAAGSDRFPNILRRIVALDAATGSVEAAIERFHPDGFIMDDYPKLLVALADRLDQDTQKRVADHLADKSCRWTASHPPHAERFARARGYKHQPAIAIDEPAAQLFRDFSKVCRAATAALPPVPSRRPLARRPTADMIGLYDHWREVSDSTKRYFRCWLEFAQGKSLSAAPVPTGTVEERIAALREVRRRLQPAETAYRQWYEKRQQMRNEINRLRIFATILRETSAESVDFEGKLTSRGPLEATLAGVQKKWDEAAAAMNKIAALDGVRLRLALSLLDDPAVRGRVPDGERLAKQAKKYLAIVLPLDDLMPRIAAVSQRSDWLQAHNQYAANTMQRLRREGLAEDKIQDFFAGFPDWIEEEAEQVRAEIAEIRVACLVLRYPFEHSTPGMSIGAFDVPDMPKYVTAEEIMELATAGTIGPAWVHYRICAELASIAEQVEDALGLDRLAAPSERQPPPPKPKQIPWHQRDIGALMPRLTLGIGLALLVLGLLTLVFDAIIGVVLISLGLVLVIGTILYLA